ncbi:MAG: hypothetical protein RIQ52_1801 [Pseudomonadota bacterium]|jgi:DNA polymerase
MSDDGMTLDSQRRAVYLDALNIRRWEPRNPELSGSVTEVSDHVSSEGAWEPLRSAVANCTACALSASRTQTVFGSGSPSAGWVIVGEAPGEQEDLRGEPFVGRAGQLLTEMLRAVGQAREDVFICNVLKCRPPQNRDPLPEETAHCLPFLRQQLALLKPRVIVAVGRIAAQNILSTQASLSNLRGQTHDYAGIPLIVTYHPAYLLRSPREKAKAWQDLMTARRIHDRQDA